MKKVLAIPILLFLIFVFAVYFILPRYSDYRLLKKEINQTRQEIQKRQAESLSAQKISDELKNYQDALNKVEAALPNGLSFASLLSFFEKKASGNGLFLKSFNPDIAADAKEEKERESNKNKSKPRFKESHFNLLLEGTFPSFANFIKIVEGSSRMIEVENISLEEKTKKSSSFKEGTPLKINLSIKVYHY